MKFEGRLRAACKGCWKEGVIVVGDKLKGSQADLNTQYFTTTS